MLHRNDLGTAFPDYQDAIGKLKQTNGHFRRLYDEYEKLNVELHRIEAGVETPEDGYVEQLKKLRLAVKDEVAHMLAEEA